MEEDEEDGTTPDLETIVYRFVRSYVLSRLDAKHDLKWKDVESKRGNEKEFNASQKDYNDKRRKIALQAFLSARSRGAKDDFIEFFASTLASVSQRLPEAHFVALSRALRDRPEEVRTLTMLALSANA